MSKLEAHTIEGIPEEIIKLAIAHQFKVDVMNLDKRVRALKEIFEAPKTDLPYARKQALRLFEKCVTAGRGDLANEVHRIMFDPSYEEKRKARQAAVDATKARYKAAMEQ
jgi:hypothetical protein